MAIEWVRDNIEVFGGDPQKITWFGRWHANIGIRRYKTGALPASNL